MAYLTNYGRRSIPRNVRKSPKPGASPTSPQIPQDPVVGQEWQSFRHEVETLAQQIFDQFDDMARKSGSKQGRIARATLRFQDMQLGDFEQYSDPDMMVEPLTIIKMSSLAAPVPKYAHTPEQPMETDTRKDSGLEMWEGTSLAPAVDMRRLTSANAVAQPLRTSSHPNLNAMRSQSDIKVRVVVDDPEGDQEEHGWAEVEAEPTIWMKTSLATIKKHQTRYSSYTPVTLYF